MATSKENTSSWQNGLRSPRAEPRGLNSPRAAAAVPTTSKVANSNGPMSPGMSPRELRKLYHAWDVGRLDDAGFRAQIHTQYPNLDSKTKDLLERMKVPQQVPLTKLITTLRGSADRSPSPDGPATGVANVVAARPQQNGHLGYLPVNGHLGYSQANSVLKGQSPRNTYDPKLKASLELGKGTRRFFPSNYRGGQVCWREGSDCASFDQMCTERGTGHQAVTPVPRLSTRSNGAATAETGTSNLGSPRLAMPSKAVGRSSNTANNSVNQGVSVAAGKVPTEETRILSGNNPRRVLKGCADEGGRPVQWRTASHQDILKWDSSVSPASPQQSPRIGGRRHYPSGKPPDSFWQQCGGAFGERRLRQQRPQYSMSSADLPPRSPPTTSREIGLRSPPTTSRDISLRSPPTTSRDIRPRTAIA